MSDEALNKHLHWLEHCEKEQVMDDYETWLEKQFAILEAENATLKMELQTAQGFVLDYLRGGNPEDQTEPFYSWAKRVDALTAEEQEDA